MTEGTNAHGPWLHSPLWDTFWFLSGFWLFGLVSLLEVMPESLYRIVFAGANCLLWYAHRLGTIYTTFCLPAYRHLVRAQRNRFVVWPTLSTLAVFGFVFAPELGAWPDFQTKLLILGTAYFFSLHLHNGTQHYGMVSILRVRAGQEPASPFKRYEKCFCLVVGGGLVAIGQICHGAEIVKQSLVYPVLSRLLPLDFFADLARFMRVTGPLVAILLTVAFCVAERRSNYPSLPKILYVGSITLQAIVVYYLNPLGFFLLWVVQHYLVALGLTGQIVRNHRERAEVASGWYRFWSRFTPRGVWPTLGALCLVSLIVTPFLEYRDLVLQWPWLQPLAALLKHSAAIHLLVAVSFSMFIAHLMMDRAVYRFSDAGVRQVTAALLFGSLFPTGDLRQPRAVNPSRRKPGTRPAENVGDAKRLTKRPAMAA